MKNLLLSLAERVLVHWRTTVGGLTTSVVVGFIAQTYVPGMTWKQWAAVAAPAVVGALLKDFWK